MVSTTSFNFAILDNSLLDSSMGSTQGLLSFMTSASRQIKTYLGDSDIKSKKKQRQQKLLRQLSRLNSCTEFIPDILEISNLNFSTTPVSPTPSLGSVGSVDDEYVTPPCSVSGRKRKRLHSSSSTSTSVSDCKISRRASYFNFNNKRQCDFDKTYFHDTTTSHRNADINNNSIDSFVPSPSPDFDDLVDCMLTDNFIAPINLNDFITST